MKLVIELPPTRLAAAPKRNPFFTQNSQSMKRAFVNEGVEQAWAGGRSHKQVPGIKRNSPVWKFDCTGFFFSREEIVFGILTTCHFAVADDSSTKVVTWRNPSSGLPFCFWGVAKLYGRRKEKLKGWKPVATVLGKFIRCSWGWILLVHHDAGGFYIVLIKRF